MCGQVAAAHVTDLKMIPDIDASTVQITVSGSNASAGLPVSIGIFFRNNGTRVSLCAVLLKLLLLFPERHVAPVHMLLVIPNTSLQFVTYLPEITPA